MPVKPLARAKSRIAEATGVHRERFALAIAADTVRAALACPSVSRVLVVTDDSVAAGMLAGLGARVVPDEPDAGLNPALRYGAGVATSLDPQAAIGALFADLPALRPTELQEALEEAGAWHQSFVADAAGDGTTLYTVTPGTVFSPAFGADSRHRHRREGAHEIRLSTIAGLRQDVDTRADLHAALDLGVGPRTAEVAALLV